MSKNIISVLFFTLLLTSWYCAADFPIVTKKYQYGYKYKDDYGSNILGEAPRFHSLVNIEKYIFLYPGYLYSDELNKKIQSEKSMFVLLNIEKNDKDKLIAITKFVNKSNKSYFIHNFFITLFKDKSMYGYSSGCRQDFLIVTNSARLEYMGYSCHSYDEDPNSGNWVKIGPGKSFSMKTYLDNSLYTFPSGLRKYSIGTLEYNFVDEDWLSFQRVNVMISAILEWQDHCGFNQWRRELIFNHDCNKNVGIVEKNFFRTNYFFGSYSEALSQHEFKIRSEPVIIEVNGSLLIK